jgi:hypothetical protein
MKSGGSLSIWFFVGISLAVNGALILGSGLYEYVHPPENPVVLFNLHASIWWGAILFLVGVVYCYHFAPGKDGARN